MQQRATAEAMRLRNLSRTSRRHVEVPHLRSSRFCCVGGGGQTEISREVMAYNLKRMVNVVGRKLLRTQPRPPERAVSRFQRPIVSITPPSRTVQGKKTVEWEKTWNVECAKSFVQPLKRRLPRSGRT